MNKLTIILLLILSACASKLPTYTQSIDAQVLKLCFIGDTGSADAHQLKVAQMLEAERCHSIHFVGDIIYPEGLKNRHDKQFQKRFWNFYKTMTEIDHKPKLYMVMGNHDHRGSIKAWTELSEKHPQIFFPYPHYLLKINNVCLTHFDTNYFRYYTNYLMMLSQSSWLKSIKPDLKECKTKIALAHHPYESSGISHGKSKGPTRYFLKKRVIGKYDFYISGHDHILVDEGLKKGTRLLISGAGGKYQAGQQNGYLVMEIQNHKVNYYFKKIQLSK